MTNLKELWSIDPNVTYLNHGSFGPSPIEVQEARAEWTRQLESQPMEFFCQRMETELDKASTRLGEFIGTKAGNLLLVDNATVGMNIAATAFDLRPDDEILFTDHEYGAVQRIWKRKCQAAKAWVVTAELPCPLNTVQGIVDAIMNRVTDKTRAIVVSHVTSQTAAILPVKEICAAARSRDVPVVIDGPHAVAMLPIDLRDIGCDFYTASCHKWLCGAFGSGFLYAHTRQQPKLKPVHTSWGGSIGGHDKHWKDDFNWIGTRDPAALLSIPTAMNFMNRMGLDRFREHGHQLVKSALNRAIEEFGATAIVPDSADWYGPMVTISIPKPNGWEPATHGNIDALQRTLRDEHNIEVPVFAWNNHRCLRVSAHLYNSSEDIDRLFEALNAAKDWPTIAPKPAKNIGFDELKNRVARWTKCVQGIAEGHSRHVYYHEYLNDMDTRRNTGAALERHRDTEAPEEIQLLENEMQQADAALRGCTEETVGCIWRDEVAEKRGWNRKSEWFYYRRPTKRLDCDEGVWPDAKQNDGSSS